MKMIENWRSAWKFLSVQANAIGIAITSTYAAMYSELKETVPPDVVAIITGAVFAAGILGRVLAQAPKDAP